MKPLVIYHGNCQDGFTAAWAIWKTHPDWEFYPAKHRDAPPDVTGRDVYMVDFSYKRPVIEKILEDACKLTILDHHKTAEADLRSLGAMEIPGFTITFNMEKSGARLAWEYFHPNELIPHIIQYVEDLDLWRFKYPETKAYSAYLFSVPYDFDRWDLINIHPNIEEIVDMGQAILDKQEKDILELSANKFRTDIYGHNVWTVNVPYTLASDMGHLLCKGEPFASTFYYDGTGFIYSLRSDDNGLDVSEIAKKFGGGGHKHAAGFKMVTTLYGLSEKQIEEIANERN